VHYANGVLVLIGLALYFWWRFFPGSLPHVRKNSPQDWLIRSLPLGAFLVLFAGFLEEDYRLAARDGRSVQLLLDLAPLLLIATIGALLIRKRRDTA
jgi:cytochrome b561